MKNPLVYTTLLVVLTGGFLLFFGLNKTAEAPLPPVDIVPTDSEGALIAELGKAVHAKGLSLTPLEVVSDSRCPVDVLCIWAGEIKVRVRIADDVEAVEKIFSIGSLQSFGEIDIILEQVLPVAYSGKTILPSEYRFEFSVR